MYHPPVGHALAVDGNVLAARRAARRHLPGLARRGHLAVDGVIDRPQRGIVVDGLRAEQVLRFGVRALRLAATAAAPWPDGSGRPRVVGACRLRPARAPAWPRSGRRRRCTRRSGPRRRRCTAGCRWPRWPRRPRRAAAPCRSRSRTCGGRGAAPRPDGAGARARSRARSRDRRSTSGGAGSASMKHHVHVVVVGGEVAIGVQHSLFAREVHVGVPRAGGGVARSVTGVMFWRFSQCRMCSTARSWLPSASRL